MIHPPQSKRKLILSGMIAAATLLISVDSAQAGVVEQRAIQANLPAGKLLNPTSPETTPTPQELASAVTAALASNARLKPGIVAGEALKSGAAQANGGAGDEIANVLTNQADKTRVVADAAKTAGTSRGGNVAQVASFAQVLVPDGETARNAARLAIASKAGAAAILQGFARKLPTDTDRTQLASAALATPQLAGAVAEIARAIASTVGDSDQFAKTVLEGLDDRTTPRIATKIVPGIVAADPTNAGEITRVLVASSDILLKTTIIKSAAALSKSIGTVADIEQVVQVGMAFAQQIGAGTPAANGRAILKTSAAAGITKALAAAIIAKPVSTTTPAGSNRNRGDEVAEVAAFVAGSIITNTTAPLITVRTAGPLFAAIIKAAVAGAKANARLKQTALETNSAYNYIADIAGSVALTVQNSTALSAEVKTAVSTYLQKQARSIGGAAFSTAVATALTQGFRGGNGTATPATDGSGDQSARFEDGNRPELALVTDPETDIRNF